MVPVTVVNNNRKGEPFAFLAVGSKSGRAKTTIDVQFLTLSLLAQIPIEQREEFTHLGIERLDMLEAHRYRPRTY